jgi:flavin-dependent dehydrogenase
VKIAIVGGGPAGSFCAIHLLEGARKLNSDIEVVIFDHKNFGKVGPGGCNLCAGVITRSMIDSLDEMSISITAEVVQCRIDGFLYISEGGRLEIKRGPDKEFYSVFRGSGPIDHPRDSGESFDSILLNHAVELGATFLNEKVEDLSWTDDEARRVIINYGDSTEYIADVVVGAFGVNSSLTRKMQKMGFGYRPPKITQVGQAEFPLPDEFIDRTYQSRIKVFCLKFRNARRVKFVALTPKKGYVTASLIGNGVGQEEVERIFEDPRILSHFPEGWKLPKKYCRCFPSLPIKHAKNAFGDRIVIVGDAHVSRFYKNGIGSAFNTASWAAENILYHGVRGKDFRKHYYKRCREFYYGDNLLGRNLFRINDIMSTNRFLSRMAIAYNRKSGEKKIIKGGVLKNLLWSLFTGELQYRDIVLQALSFKRQGNRNS